MENSITEPEIRMSMDSATFVKRLQGVLSSLAYRLTGLIFLLGTVMVLAIGWKMRQENILTAEQGTGYVLGIVGASCMLAMLLYSVRKRVRILHGLGTQQLWFKMHMLLGVVGPVLILFHANFGLGSLNSNIALICMLLVASSGLVGRFIYRKIHYGLYGKQANLKSLRENMEMDKGNLGVYLSLPEVARVELENLETCSNLDQFSLHQKIWIFLTISTRASLSLIKVKRSVKNEIIKHGKKANWDSAVQKAVRTEAVAIITHYIKTVVKITQLSTYEKLFSLWHVLHMPLFFMMLITAIIHVIAVHMY